MPLGENRAKNPQSPVIDIMNDTDIVRSYIYSTAKSNKPCIFLSHRSKNKPTVRKIAKYIAKAGIDYYLDEEDENLQEADRINNDIETVDCIHRGIDRSTHILCTLSKDTYESWWVPYEVGYGEKGGRKIASLKLIDLPESEIPQFLSVNECMIGLEKFNNYLDDIIKNSLYGGLHDKYNIRDKSRYEIDISNYEKKKSDVILKTYDSKHPLYNIIEK